jgi:hypothetical protein
MDYSQKQSQFTPGLRKAVRKLLSLLVMLCTLGGCVFPIQPPTPSAAPVATSTTAVSTTVTSTTVMSTTVMSTTVAPTSTNATAAPVADLQQRYFAALQDAKIAEPSEVFNGLTTISPTNPKLTWQKETGRVLVVTWTSFKGYDVQMGKEITLTREVWVTAVPELKTFCQAYQTSTETSLTLRLEELMGLPPNNGKTRMVELWVNPADIFRPSPDPEIDDTVAELELPPVSHFKSQQAYAYHRDWYNLQVKLDNYDDPSKGYPWTRLGYTYDWGNPQSEVGLSEFVIFASSKIMVEKVYATEEYCKQ